jgi:hypothetical protein
MASTNRTSNLHLNQWVAQDPILREDFNLDNSRLDAAVNARALVRLASATLTSASATLSLDLSDEDLTQYAGLEIFLLPKTSSVSGGAMTALAVNEEGSGTDLARMTADGTRGLEIHLAFLPGGVGGNYTALGTTAAGGFALSGVTAGDLLSLQLLCGDSAQYQPGTTCVVYGLKK